MEITAALVKKLRDKTDAPMMECKRALQQASEERGGSAAEEALFERAEELLREAGKAHVGKRADRTASQGVVAVARGEGSAAAVVLLCETDFVARNEEFKGLAQKLADHFALHDDGGSPAEAVVDGVPTSELIEGAAAKIRENIRLGPVVRVAGEGAIGVYRHHDNAKAALVLLEGGDAESQALANKVGTQVVALSPEYISKDQVDAERLAKELEFEKQRAIEAGKPAEIAEKIAQGKVSKDWLQQVVLLEQPWYADLGKKVSEIVGQRKVERFVRVAVGQEAVDRSV